MAKLIVTWDETKDTSFSGYSDRRVYISGLWRLRQLSRAQDEVKVIINKAIEHAVCRIAVKRGYFTEATFRFVDKKGDITECPIDKDGGQEVWKKEMDVMDDYLKELVGF